MVLHLWARGRGLRSSDPSTSSVAATGVLGAKNPPPRQGSSNAEMEALLPIDRPLDRQEGCWGHGKQAVLVPDSLLGVPKGLAEAGEVRVEVRRRGDDLQEPGMDLCREPGGQEGLVGVQSPGLGAVGRAEPAKPYPFLKVHQADIPHSTPSLPSNGAWGGWVTSTHLSPFSQQGKHPPPERALSCGGGRHLPGQQPAKGPPSTSFVWLPVLTRP